MQVDVCDPSRWMLLGWGDMGSSVWFVALVLVLWYYLGQFLILGVFGGDVSRFRSISGCWWENGLLSPAFRGIFGAKTECFMQLLLISLH